MTLPLLILRPEPGASATARRAAKLGLTTTLYPLFQIRPSLWEPPETGNFDAMLLTSANAVRHGGPGLFLYKHLPVYAVGEATAQAAREAGFQLAGVGQSGAQAISDIMARRAHARVFHPGGRDRREFNPGPITLVRRCVYEAAEVGTAEGLAAASPQETVALLHSPRGGVRLAKLVPMIDRQRFHLAAISSAALDAAGAGWASGDWSPRPLDEALLALAAGLCK